MLVIQGVWSYPSIDELPAVPDLAVIATPAPQIPGIIAALGAAGLPGSRARAGNPDQGDRLRKSVLTGFPGIVPEKSRSKSCQVHVFT